MTERSLAEAVVAAEERTAVADVDPETLERVRIRLRHADLPKLDDAGLVRWDRDRATVAAGDHPVIERPAFQALLEVADNRYAEIALDRRCREVLDAIESSDGQLTLDELVTDLLVRDGPDEAEDLRIELHHVCLPKLAAANLLEYDPADETIAPQDAEDGLDGALLDALDDQQVTQPADDSQIKIP